MKQSSTPRGMKTRCEATTLYLLAALAALPFGGQAFAQGTADWSYEIGIRSTIMVSTMPLSELGAGFADLHSGGKALPHSSSIFVMWPRGEHLRIGVETLVGNSYPASDTQILFQAAGVVAEYQTSGRWFAAAGVQGGGMIVSATQSPESDADDVALGNGVHYKESGVFLAPQISIGRQVGHFDVRLVGRQVFQFGATGVDAFDSAYAGISVGLLRR